MGSEIEQGRKVDVAFKKVVNQIDKEYLRPLQISMHLCAAKCCENQIYSLEEVQRCISNCSRILSEAEDIVKDEFNIVQNRLHRGVEECRDNVKVSMVGTPTQEEMEKLNKEFENCVVKSIDTNIQSVPSMLNRLRQRLSVLKNKNNSMNTS